MVNHLLDLGKTFEREKFNVKVLKGLNRTWQAKSTTKSKYKDFTTMMVATIFGKLEEYELDLGRLKDEEEVDKKKGLALKTRTSHHEASDEDPLENLENKNLNFLVNKFSKFMKKKWRDKRNFQKKNTQKSDSTPTTYTCFECKKQGHIKTNCRTYLKKEQGGDKKEKKPFKNVVLATTKWRKYKGGTWNHRRSLRNGED